jgi:signal peptidase II
MMSYTTSGEALAQTSPFDFMRFLLGAAGAALALDWASKTWVRSHIPFGGATPLVPGWIHLQHVQNHGAAWSVLAGQRLFLIGFTLVVIVMLAISAREIARQGALAATAFGLILGGALGNFFDRALQGFVTDFFDLDTPFSWLQTFPVFNVADSALTLGVIILLASMASKQFERPESATASGDQAEVTGKAP